MCEFETMKNIDYLSIKMKMAQKIGNPKKIIFAHSAGAQSGTGEGSFDLVTTFRTELSNEYIIYYPVIDNPEAPTYKMWKKLFDAEFRNKTEPFLLVGHSLGSSMLLKYLSEENPDISISGLFLISTPLWGKNGWDVEDFVLKDGFEAKLKDIRNVYFYHCKNYEIVPLHHLNFYRSAFPHANIKVINGSDHAFASGLPELVSDIKVLK